ncbi:MAG: hypothetical protein FWE80_08900 [Oscillospiraceae bacterium]|nr:hypothetical protein [Oscillospiraceae bacterium]
MAYTKVIDTPAADPLLYGLAPLTDEEKAEMAEMLVTGNGLREDDPPGQPGAEDVLKALLAVMPEGGAGGE